MKRVRFYFLLLLMMCCVTTLSAQKHGKGFDPKRFEADMEQYIVTEAGLTVQESARFFPIFRQLQRKQRAIFGEMNRYRHTDTRDNIASRIAIEKMDAADLEMKRLQQTYHKKFMKVLSAGKVLKVIKAEDKFHRMAFRKAFKHCGNQEKCE